MALLAAAMLAALWSAPTPDAGPDARTYARAARVEDRVGPKGFMSASRACPADRERCVGISLHVVTEDGTTVQPPKWFARQVAVANRHFAAINVGFRVAEVHTLPATDHTISTRQHRDEIGARRFSKGVIHVFLIGRLDDVDAVDAEIRGVHWRLRRNVEKRWILLSAISSDMVLAHELGHFFGLPHSRYPISIMNKRPRERPPRKDRTFHTEEVAEMKRELEAIVGPAGPLFRPGSR
jgi:hypothetical protein